MFKGDSKNINTASVKRDISHLPEKIRAYNGTWQGQLDNFTLIIIDIQVISEKKVIVNNAWEDNHIKPHIKAGSWQQETKFNEDGVISIIRGDRITTIKLNKDSTLNVIVKSTDSGLYTRGDLDKIE